MIARYSIAFISGLVATFAVLFLMQALISTAKRELNESGRRHFVDFVRVERGAAVQRKQRRADKPVEPESPPDLPQPRTETVEPVEMAISVSVDVPVQTEMTVRGLEMAVSDGEYLPIVKIAPAYPAVARSRGIEGYCTVEYTVTATGTTADVVVVDADPTGIFDKASVAAALKFKYKPRVVNGEPISVRGVRNIFRYSLED